MNFFVTGTDTDVGKSFFTVLLTRALRAAGFDTVAMKPVSCGEPGDTVLLRDAAERELSLDEVTPVSYAAPLAPVEAARLEGRRFDPEAVLGTFRRIRNTRASVLVEGVGGWLVPISESYSGADLAKDLGLPVLLVVRNRLGSLNHALLTLESIRSHGLTCAGIALNHHPADSEDISLPGNKRLLAELAGVPVLFEITPGQTELVLAVA